MSAAQCVMRARALRHVCIHRRSASMCMSQMKRRYVSRVRVQSLTPGCCCTWLQGINSCAKSVSVECVCHWRHGMVILSSRSLARCSLYTYRFDFFCARAKSRFVSRHATRVMRPSIGISVIFLFCGNQACGRQADIFPSTSGHSVYNSITPKKRKCWQDVE